MVGGRNAKEIVGLLDWNVAGGRRGIESRGFKYSTMDESKLGARYIYYFEEAHITKPQREQAGKTRLISRSEALHYLYLPF